MIWGVPLVGDRVAPRCTFGDALLLVSVSRGQVASRVRLDVSVRSAVELAGALAQHGAEGLVCGGVSADARETLAGLEIDVVDNVACSADEVVAALDAGILCSGYGFGGHPAAVPRDRGSEGRDARDSVRTIDCLSCEDRICMSGLDCVGAGSTVVNASADHTRWLDGATDVVREEERRLCRVAEVVYFCLEMRFQRVGIAFCSELLEPCRVLGSVLGRFFEVVPVCCRVGGADSRGDGALPCNPTRQAQILNDAHTDINVAAGLCIGADCVFNQASLAPVTTLFVKDKSLAHNPIGAVYSEHYIRESLQTPGRASRVEGTEAEIGRRGTVARPGQGREA